VGGRDFAEFCGGGEGRIWVVAIAAAAGDRSGALKNLKSAGRWAFDVATKLGVSVASKALEHSLGMS
jgi:hypothetical protein